jgi:hypothetical protein
MGKTDQSITSSMMDQKLRIGDMQKSEPIFSLIFYIKDCIASHKLVGINKRRLTDPLPQQPRQLEKNRFDEVGAT